MLAVILNSTLAYKSSNASPPILIAEKQSMKAPAPIATRKRRLPTSELNTITKVEMIANSNSELPALYKNDCTVILTLASLEHLLIPLKIQTVRQ